MDSESSRADAQRVVLARGASQFISGVPAWRSLIVVWHEHKRKTKVRGISANQRSVSARCAHNRVLASYNGKLERRGPAEYSRGPKATVRGRRGCRAQISRVCRITTRVLHCRIYCK